MAVVETGGTSWAPLREAVRLEVVGVGVREPVGVMDGVCVPVALGVTAGSGVLARF